MREVLFRGKRKDNGEWVYGAYVSHNWYPVDDEREEFDGVVVEESNIISYEEDCLWYRVIPESVSEFTGLTDKKGKKIFEGDILQVITGDGWSCPKGTKVYYEVVFIEFNPENASWSEYIGYMAKGESGALRSLANVIRRYDAVVVGNIHDNSELLKGGAE